MSTRRFEITPVPESPSSNSSSLPEIIPLIHIENEIPPPPPPIPTSLPSNNGKTNRLTSGLFATMLKRKALDARRRVTLASAFASMGHQINKSSSAEILHKHESISSHSQTNHGYNTENTESDVYSTTHSNNYDSNPSSITNKFLQELRTKRRELLEKRKHISIDTRIDLNRQLKNQRQILRAQDIFAVHFQLNDDDNDDSLLLSSSQTNLYTEESQEKIRNEIYNELNRQQMKQYRKHNRHLFFGRSLLLLMTSLFAFMSLTLIYVVIDLYNRSKNLDAKLPDYQFQPIPDVKPFTVS
ncbi:unnamed protein product [Adineta steineri]|uniref:Uncharacterized protein n=1 Tax=Adineta steineri TaxID=433720 RepID=A0A815KID3_9BILA|nr:unnamed protein product [Adineta steineri]CAF1617399.1 unnamed protein product [Adineta steineri]